MIGLAAGGGLGLAIGTFIAYRTKQDLQSERLDVFTDKRDDILRDVVYKTGSVNAIVLVIHNGGSKLTEGKNWYSSVVAEAPAFESVSAIDFWQNKPVDKKYKGMIRELRDTKMNWVHTDGPKIGEQLLRLYSRMSIVGSIVVELYADEYLYYYASFPVADNYEELLKNAVINEYELAQTHLARLHSKADKDGVLRMDWERLKEARSKLI